MFLKLRMTRRTEKVSLREPANDVVIITNHVNQSGQIESRFIFTEKINQRRFIQLVQPQFKHSVREKILLTVDKAQLQNSCFSVYWSLPDNRTELSACRDLEEYVLDLLRYYLGLENLRIQRAASYAEVGEFCREYHVNLAV